MSSTDHLAEITVNDAAKTRIFEEQTDGTLLDVTPPEPEETPAAAAAEKPASAKKK